MTTAHELRVFWARVAAELERDVVPRYRGMLAAPGIYIALQQDATARLHARARRDGESQLLDWRVSVMRTSPPDHPAEAAFFALDRHGIGYNIEALAGRAP